MRRARPCLAAILAGALFAPAVAGAESALRSVPEIRSAYKLRADAIAAGETRGVFLGSASVAPNYGFPWMVSLQIKGADRNNAHFCGGVAVAPAWVLTAAHCVIAPAADGDPSRASPLDPAGLQVLSGSNLLSTGGKISSVDRIVLHPEYSAAADRVPTNDLALLHLAGAPSLSPIELLPAATVDEIIKEDEKVRVFGWGTASFRADGPISNNLLYAFVDVVGTAKCNDPAVYDGAVTDSMFCAGLGSSDTCQGDSGGPAIGYVNGEKYLIGITSWGVGCADKRYPGVYVNATKYAAWIREVSSKSK